MAAGTGPAAPVPPQALDAEESVLGALMLSPGVVEAVGEAGLDSADFYRESHAAIYRAALALHADGEPVDPITLVRRLEERGELEAVGGRARIHELASIVPASANASHYARIVREKATLRGLVAAGAEVARLGQEEAGEPAEILDRAESVLYGLTRERARHRFVAAAEAAPAAYQRMVERQERGGGLHGLGTGLADLDRQLGGLPGGSLVVVAARPSMGKTALALTAVADVVLRQRVSAVLFTLEMSADEVAERLIAQEARVDLHRIRVGGLSLEEWGRVTAATDEVARAPLLMDDAAEATAVEVRTRARRLKARDPSLGLVVVDYLQLMTSGERTESRVQDVSVISRALKHLARELDVPVLALSQLSRAVEQRHDKRPMLADLRESGAIEQDSDVVAFIYRDDYYHPEEAEAEGTAGVAEINIAKHRNGPTGIVKAAFVKRFALFSDLAR